MKNRYFFVRLELPCQTCKTTRVFVSKQSKHGIDYHECIVCKVQIVDSVLDEMYLDAKKQVNCG